MTVRRRAIFLKHASWDSDSRKHARHLGVKTGLSACFPFSIQSCSCIHFKWLYITIYPMSFINSRFNMLMCFSHSYETGAGKEKCCINCPWQNDWSDKRLKRKFSQISIDIYFHVNFLQGEPISWLQSWKKPAVIVSHR